MVPTRLRVKASGLNRTSVRSVGFIDFEAAF
jgi:hypothetical protein